MQGGRNGLVIDRLIVGRTDMRIRNCPSKAVTSNSMRWFLHIQSRIAWAITQSP